MYWLRRVVGDVRVAVGLPAGPLLRLLPPREVACGKGGSGGKLVSVDMLRLMKSK